MKKVVVVQVRGGIGLSPKVKDTLNMLRLRRKNACTVIDNSDIYTGMLLRVKDYVTWGEIDTDTLKLLLEKRGRLPGNKSLTEDYLKSKVKMGFADVAKNIIDGKLKFKDVPGLKSFFRLNPPVHGFEHAGTKKAFSLGGALGYRGIKINDLLKRMV